MSNKHLRTLVAVFETPTPSNIPWREIESLLVAAGAAVRGGRGSRVRFSVGPEQLFVHRPHPQKEARPATVRDVRDFFRLIGVTP